MNITHADQQRMFSEIPLAHAYMSARFVNGPLNCAQPSAYMKVVPQPSPMPNSLALVLGSTGSKNPVTLASELLASFDGWRGLLAVTTEELALHPGMTRQRAAQVKAALEIGRRLLQMGNPDRVQIKSPADAGKLLMIEMSHLDQEHLKVILPDTKNRILKIYTVYIGTLNSSTVRVAEVFKEAIRLNAAAIIVSHNHPSGETTPSPVIWRIVFVKWQSVADRRSLPILPDRSRPRRCARPPDGGPAQP